MKFHTGDMMIRAVLLSLPLVLFLAIPARPQPASSGFTSCSKGVAADRRQSCDEEALKQVEAGSRTLQLGGGWRMVKTRDPGGGPDAVSVMHSVDSAKSDVGLAGLSLQCGRDGTEVVLIVLDPLSRSARPKVALTTNGKRTELEASVIRGGETLLLPRPALDLATGEWRSATELSVEIDSKPDPIRGSIPIAGLASAMLQLTGNCPMR